MSTFPSTTPHKSLSDDDIEIQPGLWFDPVSIALYQRPPTTDATPIVGHIPEAVPPRSAAIEDTKIEILVFPSKLLFDEKLDWLPGDQLGRAVRMDWVTFTRFLADSRPGDPVTWANPDQAKRARGGWVGGSWRGNHRAIRKLIATQVMTIDIDGNGDVDRLAACVATMRAIIHSTYKSTVGAPRCRLVILLSEPCTDARLYGAGHKAMQALLLRWGYRPGDIDEGAHDCSRLNYAPMHQPGVKPQFRSINGEPLDLKKLVAAQTQAQKPKAQATRPQGPKKPDAYKAAALRRAHDAMTAAIEGDRHALLFREAASLARPDLGCTDDEIIDALLAAFIRAAGSDRAKEGARTINDAIKAGRSGQ